MDREECQKLPSGESSFPSFLLPFFLSTCLQYKRVPERKFQEIQGKQILQKKYYCPKRRDLSKEKYYTLLVFHKHKSSENYQYIYGKIQKRVNKVNGYCRLKRPRDEEGSEPLGYVPWPLMTAGGSVYVMSSPCIS